MEKTHFIRDLLFQQVYELMSKSALNNGAAQGSNFWNLYSSGVRCLLLNMSPLDMTTGLALRLYFCALLYS